MVYNEFERNHSEYSENGRNTSTDDDLYGVLQEENDDREVDFGTLIDVLVELSPNCSYNQRRKILDNFGYLLERKVHSLDDKDLLITNDQKLTDNLLDIHAGRITDDDSIKKCFSKLKKLFTE